MRAVDTNVLVRLLMRDDPDQVSVAEAFVQPGAWVSHLVIMEAVWVMGSAYGISPSEIGLALEMLLGQERLVIQDTDAVRAAVAAYRERPAIGFADCLILEVARKAGHLPLGTFDRALAKLGGTQRL